MTKEYNGNFCKGCGSLLKNLREKCPNCASIKKAKQSMKKKLMANCTKCGELIKGDEDSICGACSGEELK